MKKIVSRGGGGGGIAKKFFSRPPNILRLHMTFSKKSGRHMPHAPQAPGSTALRLDKSIHYCMIVKGNMVKVK